MTNKNLSTDSYKGVRDFYPEDMAVQQYIFSTWAKTAESFGFERYDASVLEPSELYKAKGAENEEMVNEQTYTFTDRGGREVTLRPEMTPTVARMIAGRWRELASKAPIRWYSIPNMFRYERMQKGRLREHWQFNCDIFGVNDVSMDVEIIALAYQIFKNFGATDDMFTIYVNNRATMQLAYQSLGITDAQTITTITRLNDKKDKISGSEYLEKLNDITNDSELSTTIKKMIEAEDSGDNAVVAGLRELGIKNVILDRSLARGFDYYTGTIFEIKDTSGENNRTLCGGGRYDNLTSMFGNDAVSGIGFGFGDVSLRDFLETHKLLPDNLSFTTAIVVIPMDEALNLEAQKIAKQIRDKGISVSVDAGKKRVGEKIGRASDKGVEKVIVIGENEVSTQVFTLKNLKSGEEKTGSLLEIIV